MQNKSKDGTEKNEAVITLTSDNEKIDVEVIDETVVNGEVYLLVSNITTEEDEDRECFILKDMSNEGDEESTYVVASDKEQEEIYEVFKKKLISEDIILG